jgi:UDP-N-acetylglucosamine--N-acetylmuramyl-(pentapeptide) pyrophosphoryl-undecaprenol N-acetylglucosamine transferase
MALLEALEYLENRENIFFVHQTGAQDETQVKRRYDEHGIENDTRTFFKDMARQYQSADFIICRAGATTVAEIKAIGKGVIFIPFPFAADNHQVLNARSLEKAGAAEMILEKDISGKVLAERINYYVQRPEALQQMSSRSRSLGRVDAAAMIVDDCYELVGLI